MNADGSSYLTSPVVGYMRSAQKNDPQLDEWESQIRAHAKERGYNLVSVLREKQLSNAATHRPVLAQLIRELEKGAYVGVIVVNLQSLSGSAAGIARMIAAIQNANCWIEAIAPG